MALPGDSSLSSLSLAAHAVTTVLTSANRKHAFIGGYAANCLGGGRATLDVDLIISDHGEEIRKILLDENKNFSMSKHNKLQYTPPFRQDTIDIELLRGGTEYPLKLPDVASAPILLFDDGIPVPILHPRLLVITKVKRWRFLADSTRPQSELRAAADRNDIGALLRWLEGHGETIDFDEYGAKPAVELLSGFRQLYSMCFDLRSLLERVLGQDDFAYVSRVVDVDVGVT